MKVKCSSRIKDTFYYREYDFDPKKETLEDIALLYIEEWHEDDVYIHDVRIEPFDAEAATVLPWTIDENGYKFCRIQVHPEVTWHAKQVDPVVAPAEAPEAPASAKPPPSLKSLQKEVIANRVRRGWPSATDLVRTTTGLAEETGEFERARRRGDKPAMIDALADVAAYCLGGFEILESDGHAEIAKVVEANKNRTDQVGHH